MLLEHRMVKLLPTALHGHRQGLLRTFDTSPIAR